MQKIILCDLDGTLSDPREGIFNCIQYALDSMGVKLADHGNLNWCIGPPLRESFRKLLGTEDVETIEGAKLDDR
jgi:phosphoglycolate phosphatase